MLDHSLKRVLGGLLRATAPVYCRRKSDPVVMLDGVVSSRSLAVITLYDSDLYAVLRSFTRGLGQRLSVKRHEAVRREFGVPGDLLLKFLNLCTHCHTTEIGWKKFQPATFADVVIEQPQQGVWIEHLDLRFFRYCERWSDPTQRNSRFRPLGWFVHDGECVALSLRDLPLWVRDVLNGRKARGNQGHAGKVPIGSRERSASPEPACGSIRPNASQIGRASCRAR